MSKFIELVKPIRLSSSGGAVVRSVVDDSLGEASANDLRDNPLLFAPAYRLAAETRAGSWDGVSLEREQLCAAMSRADCQAALAHIEGSPLEKQRAGIKQFWSKIDGIEKENRHD